jgi:CRP-like cAMP-binding protein
MVESAIERIDYDTRSGRPPRAAKTRGDAHDFLMATIAPNSTLPAETVEHIRKAFVPRAFRKGQFFLRAGEVPLHGGFVTRGLFRMYTIDPNGNESIVRFSPEGAWIGDLQSAASGVATRYFVDAIEPSEALIIDHPSFERMIELSPDKGHGYRMGLQRSRDAMERRIALYLHASAEER